MKKVVLVMFFVSIQAFGATSLQTLSDTYERIMPGYLVDSHTVYQSQSIRCVAIAEFAAMIVSGKENGISYSDARLYAASYLKGDSDGVGIVDQVYKGDARKLDVPGAYSMYGVACDYLRQNSDTTNN